ncbi:hypothetical protein Aduo_002603 [Ancylostoma duodenale]
MLEAIPCSSALSTRSRPFSAYSNLCSVEEDADVVESQLIDWHSDVDEFTCELEVEIHRESSQPGGLAFRIIGSRTSGIFVSYVDSKSQQASQLQEGDRIKECNGKNLSGITCDQAASILRFSLSREDVLHLRIQRRGSGPSLMSKRRSLVHLSQEQEEHYRITNSREFGGNCSFKLRQSVSCPDYRPNSNLPVRVSVTNSKLLRKVESIDEEIQLLMENQEQPSLESSM